MEVSQQTAYFPHCPRKRKLHDHEIINSAKVRCVNQFEFHNSSPSLCHDSCYSEPVCNNLSLPSPPQDSYDSNMMDCSNEPSASRACPQCLAGQGGHLTHMKQ